MNWQVVPCMGQTALHTQHRAPWRGCSANNGEGASFFDLHKGSLWAKAGPELV